MQLERFFNSELGTWDLELIRVVHLFTSKFHQFDTVNIVSVMPIFVVYATIRICVFTD
ncbi:MAG: hypothetical protein ABIP78_04720 [Pyrinomonadaceae bacterium]